MSVRLASRDGAKADKYNDGSDGECHPEDDEVKSLSLSEDGPVIRRSFSEGAGFAGGFFGRDRHNVHAPDPIAMLTDGTRPAPSFYVHHVAFWWVGDLRSSTTT